MMVQKRGLLLNFVELRCSDVHSFSNLLKAFGFGAMFSLNNIDLVSCTQVGAEGQMMFVQFWFESRFSCFLYKAQ